MHDSRIWNGHEVIENATREPARITTKQEYWDLLKSQGLRMQHQAESDVPSSVAPAPEPLPPELQPPEPPAPLSLSDAHGLGAMSALLGQRGYVETLWCQRCFAAKRWHGVRLRIGPTHVFFECRCGAAEYRPPTGTTDWLLTRLANTALTHLDRVAGLVVLPTGVVMRPTTMIQDEEAKLLHWYARWCDGRDLTPEWFCRSCWNGVPDPSQAVAMKIAADEIVITCQCRTLFWRGRRLTIPATAA
jgi:hypothetical protein